MSKNNIFYIHLCSFIFVYEDARGVTVIVVRRGLGYLSSNPERGCLYFTLALICLEKVWIQLFSLSAIGKIIWQTALFDLCIVTGLREGKLWIQTSGDSCSSLTTWLRPPRLNQVTGYTGEFFGCGGVVLQFLITVSIPKTYAIKVWSSCV